jgi:hypothetical protein
MTGSRQKTCLSGSSALRRLTRLISVATPQVVPAGAAVMVSMMNSVEPSQSAAWITSSRHSGWTMMLTPGCSARAAAICSTEKRACTEQYPFQRISFAACRARGLFPQREERIPDDHLLGRDPRFNPRDSAQMLVWEEEFFAPRKGPVEDAAGVGRRAYDPAVAAAEGFQGGGGVHVGDEDHVADTEPGQCVPGGLVESRRVILKVTLNQDSLTLNAVSASVSGSSRHVSGANPRAPRRANEQSGSEGRA